MKEQTPRQARLLRQESSLATKHTATELFFQYKTLPRNRLRRAELHHLLFEKLAHQIHIGCNRDLMNQRPRHLGVVEVACLLLRQIN
jgi:hypothetical protein